MAIEPVIRRPMDEIDRLFQELLARLIEQKYREDNRDFAREIAITHTETEKAYAYFSHYVKPNMEEK